MAPCLSEPHKDEPIDREDGIEHQKYFLLVLRAFDHDSGVVQHKGEIEWNENRTFRASKSSVTPSAKRFAYTKYITYIGDTKTSPRTTANEQPLLWICFLEHLELNRKNVQVNVQITLTSNGYCYKQPRIGYSSPWYDTNQGEDTLVDKILNIQHHLNPLHVYCRLVEKGWSKRVSISICRYYEILIYSWLTWFIAIAVQICRFIRPTS